MGTTEDVQAILAKNEKGAASQTINNCMIVFQHGNQFSKS